MTAPSRPQRHLTCSTFIIVIVGCCGLLHRPASATVLTFDIFTDPDDPAGTQVPDPSSIPNNPQPAYGTNVTDFSPSTPLGPNSYYVSYGSAGGPTNGITVQYRWLHETNLADNGVANAQTWKNGYSDLTNVVWSNQGANYLTEVRFIPAPGQQVLIHSFDVGNWISGILPNQTVRITQDASTTPVTLWFAGTGDNGYTVPPGNGNPHVLFTPMILVKYPHTVGILFGDSGNIGIDNIRFEIPEPASIGLLGFGLCAVTLRRTRPSN